MIRCRLAAACLFAVSVAACTQTGGSGSATTQAPAAAPVTINVDLAHPGAAISPTMWGAFFEDINFGADGGLYAQLIKNDAFEFPGADAPAAPQDQRSPAGAMTGWFMIRPSLAKGSVSILTDSPYKTASPHYLHIVSAGDFPMGVSNEGFRGIGVTKGDAYDFSTEMRLLDGAPKITVELVGGDGTTLDSVPLTGAGPTWSKVSATLHPNATDPKARLTVILTGPGAADFDFVSLFPENTWMHRPGGLRADMVQALADLHPGFLRFPGGCVVEGSVLATRYQWKNTIGPVEDRHLLVNRWNYEFKHRPTPDYYQTFGLGFFEFFQLCEDIHAQPLPIVNCGMACQFNSGELCTPEELSTYIQDALDLIEFANGPADSTWGAKRAAMGHPAPFNMKMMGVGNEQWGPQYLERLAAFTAAIKKVHPEITLVSDSGPSPSDDRFDFLWPKLNETHADIVDQHCYANPLWFLSNSTRFDNYERSGPKVFFGEYAAQSVAIVSTKNRNNVECALSEAAYMTGMERNADVVRMASYAPLFANVDAWQWTPNLIWTDSLRVMPTPNYYVQQLFTTNRGDEVLPTSNTSKMRDILPAGRIGVGANHATAEFKDIHVSTVGDILPDAPWTGGDSWKSVAGVYSQTDPKATTSSFVGDPKWQNYTLTLKARKTGGDGSLVIYALANDAGAYASWSLGGADNSTFALVTHYAEQDQYLAHAPGNLELNRWYDIKIVVAGDQMQCSLDGKPLQSAQVLHLHVPALFTSAAHDVATGDTIIKVVNPGDAAAPAAIHLAGASSLAPTATLLTFTGSNADEDTFERPNATAPKSTTLSGIKPIFPHTFPARSFSVIRVHPAAGARAAATTPASAP